MIITVFYYSKCLLSLIYLNILNRLVNFKIINYKKKLTQHSSDQHLCSILIYLFCSQRPVVMDKPRHGEGHGEHAKEEVGQGHVSNQDVACGLQHLERNNATINRILHYFYYQYSCSFTLIQKSRNSLTGSYGHHQNCEHFLLFILIYNFINVIYISHFKIESQSIELVQSFQISCINRDFHFQCCVWTDTTHFNSV